MAQLHSPSDTGQQPLAAVDRAWLRMDVPTNLMVVNALLWLREPLPHAELEQLMRERINWIPRMRQIPQDTNWTTVDVDVAAHLHEHELPADIDEQELHARIGALISVPLERERPLWELHLLQRPGQGSMVLTRVHHCIGDGLAQLLLLLALTEREAEPCAHPLRSLFETGEVAGARSYIRELMPRGMKLLLRADHLALEAATGESIERRRPEGLEGARAQVRRALNIGSAATRDLASLVLRRPDSATLLRGPLSTHKRAAWSRAWPLAELKARGKALDATINDLLIAALSGGLRRYLVARGRSPHRVELRAAVPINLRGLAELRELGNRFGLVFLELPVGMDHPRERLREVHRRMDALKHSIEPLVTWGLLELMGHAPEAFEDALLAYFAERVSCVMTNVPGPEQHLYLAGSELEGMMFWVPQSGRVGLGLSICSYAGELRFGVMSEASLIPDPERLVDCVERELAALGAHQS